MNDKMMRVKFDHRISLMFIGRGMVLKKKKKKSIIKMYAILYSRGKGKFVKPQVIIYCLRLQKNIEINHGK